MADYSALKATINANVKTNGNQEITGAIMNSVLNAMVTTLGAGYQYAGVATPSTNPGTPDTNVFYLAYAAGTYTHFGGISVGDEIAVLKYNGSWVKDVIGAATKESLDTFRGEVENEIYNLVQTRTPISLSSFFQGIMRKTTLKFGESTNQSLKVFYIPVVAGRSYNVYTITNLYLDSPNFTMLGFSASVPANGGDFVELLSFDSAGNKTYNETYAPSTNGYLCIFYQNTNDVNARISCGEIVTSKTSKIGDLSNLETTNKSNLVAAINELVNQDANGKIGDLSQLSTTAKTNLVAAINELYAAAVVLSSETHHQMTLDQYVSYMIMRNTTGLFEATSNESHKIIYLPVVAGRRYVVNGTNVYLVGATWSEVGFSPVVPAGGVTYVDLLSFDSAGDKTFEYVYNATSNGYLCIAFSNAISILNERLQVVEYESGEAKYAAPLIIGGKVAETEDAKDGLENGDLSFNIGLTNLRSTSKNPETLVIGQSGSNYNDCIKQYINTQDGRRTSKLIPSGVINIDPHIGDFSTLGTTYWREVIGVDSEGWIYVAQRKYANLSQGADVNIYRTKDLVTFELFKSNSCGHQLIEMENGELCLATYETETIDGTSYIRCFIYITTNHKTSFVKKITCTQISQYSPASPWSWGIQSRGKVVAIGEYGQHGQCGKVWYSRDYGENFYEVFDLRDNAPDVPHAHVHGICVDPYFDRLYIINGDGSPATTPELLGKNPRIWYWDYNGETLSNNLINTITWKYVSVGENTSLGSGLQFVGGYALKDCILLTSDGSNNGIFRINRTKKEDVPTIDFAHHLGIEGGYTKFCGGNMFKRNENSPLFVCMIREYSCDLDPGDPGNPSNKPNTYKDVPSRIFSTYDGYHFEEVWIDDTYGRYLVHYTDGTSEQRNLAKCGRDMSIWQLPSGDVILKYIGRDFGYVAFNNNGVTSVTKTAYVDFANDVAKFVLK